jgi:hypothetical protein
MLHSFMYSPPVPVGKAGERAVALGVLEHLADPFRDRPDFPPQWRSQ